uniref:Uncharacterized protein n=1 Tax=Vespula pensylvanica TaxID=30213 RepID=A0A834P6Q3_VESPE|nr:hypothetical protein H0235_006382 [Vespula pensylvanica]
MTNIEGKNLKVFELVRPGREEKRREEKRREEKRREEKRREEKRGEERKGEERFVLWPFDPTAPGLLLNTPPIHSGTDTSKIPPTVRRTTTLQNCTGYQLTNQPTNQPTNLPAS